MESIRAFDILYAEDDPDDQVLVKDAVKESGINCNVHIIGNGQALLNRLLHTDLEGPDLILLDLNMPMMDGREALKEIV